MLLKSLEFNESEIVEERKLSEVMEITDFSLHYRGKIEPTGKCSERSSECETNE